MGEDTHSTNIGKSDYSKHLIQPWHIWQCYNLNPWDADIIKRVLRIKDEEGMSANEARKMDYEKIIHNCQERIRQIDIEERIVNDYSPYPRQVLCTKTWLMNDGDKLLEMFTENRYYNQPCEDMVIDNDSVRIYVTKENFKKYFKE